MSRRQIGLVAAARVLGISVLGTGVLGFALLLALHASAAIALAPLRTQACEPLRVVDHHGQELRVLPAACGPQSQYSQRGSHAWVQLSQVPRVLQDAVVVSEDKRFAQHPGVDVVAVARALWLNLRARHVVSGASTITMQLMRMLHHSGRARSGWNKLSEAWLALSAERAASKDELLEAYLNHAYYGRGAYGVGAAAHTYFGKAPEALSDAEATLLAVLPRAPRSYDPTLHAALALRRRHAVLGAMVAATRLSHSQAAAIEAQALSLQSQVATAASLAPHFVDWVVQTLPPAQARAGGVLTTTLELELQAKLEALVAAHVVRLRAHGVTQAGVVVLDARTSEVLAMVGSADYAQSQLNLAVRRRHPGSLLKPFVYALAVEAGQRPGSLALDVGDVESAFHTRDWIGHEGGALPLGEALAGSYNLAAVHTLEQVGVGALRERLRRLGVAQLSQPAERYGLQLALGSARVRLLDVAMGFGFMVREGLVRHASGVRQLQRFGERVYAPDERDLRAFSPQVSWLVMEMLSNPSNRHRRFGLGLPVEGVSTEPDSRRVVAKTGTASGMSDMTSVLATRQYVVGAWSGRFDGKPARGTSGMWSAAPLARLALDTALAGRAPSLPERPAGVNIETVCAVSGLRAQPACPQVRQRYALSSTDETPACTWHHDDDSKLHAPAELQAWLGRARAQGPRLDFHPR